MNATRTVDVKDALNRSMPAADRAKLGDTIHELVAAHNALVDALVAASTAGVTADMKVKNIDER